MVSRTLSGISRETDSGAVREGEENGCCKLCFCETNDSVVCRPKKTDSDLLPPLRKKRIRLRQTQTLGLGSHTHLTERVRRRGTEQMMCWANAISRIPMCATIMFQMFFILFPNYTHTITDKRNFSTTASRVYTYRVSAWGSCTRRFRGEISPDAGASFGTYCCNFSRLIIQDRVCNVRKSVKPPVVYFLCSFRSRHSSQVLPANSSSWYATSTLHDIYIVVVRHIPYLTIPIIVRCPPQTI